MRSLWNSSRRTASCTRNGFHRRVFSGTCTSTLVRGSMSWRPGNREMSILSRPEYLLRPQNILRRVVLRPFLKRRQVTVKLAFGKRITVQEGEFIGNNIINTLCHDPALGECLWRLVSEGDVCVDVGANIGYTTLVMAHRCGDRGKCISFEADPALHKRLV